jgi:hypothetical protein
MVFCRASPVKVYVPSNGANTASRCEACWQGCPFYVEAGEGADREIRSFENESKKGARAP